ncbi:hypothetical protein PILCRDRAFT_824683 [Piloderma croceum F 1598]|uniref:ATP-dependent RNA helicase n=1 Tax=Piloderma croceum (strain F 1598) TaxID=765440 RepID=A0A0C3F0A5_PILCF|nr:hypothetical protein PILCRDRAFT_824683 [Piloderma croceum F 1598]
MMVSSMWSRAARVCGRACAQTSARHGLTTISAAHQAVAPLCASHVRRSSVQALQQAQAQEVTKHSRSRTEPLLYPSSFPEEGQADIETLRPPPKAPKIVLDSGAPAEPMDMSRDKATGPLFSSLKDVVSYETLKALTAKPFNLVHMSLVQAEVLPLLPQLAEPYSEVDDGSPRPPRDLLVKARTGTGKTLAFLVPAVEARLKGIEAFARQAVKDAGLTSDQHMEGRARRAFTREHVGTLILSPTRELATQIANEALRLTHYHKDFEVRLFVGGSSKRLQMRDWMKGRRDIVVATPGRLRDLLHSEPEVARGISKTKMFILDEADTLLDMGFRDDIDAIADYLPKTPARQTFLFSATVSRSIQQIARATLDRNHVFINTVSDSDSPVHAHVPQYHTVLPSASEQIPHLLRLLAHDQLINPGKSKSIVFLPTTKMTQLFATLLRELSKTTLPSLRHSKVYEIHSKRTQEARTMTSDSFRADKSGSSILVTSDVSARGVDYPGVTRVIQVGIPGSTEQYIHRVGRTGRAGAGTQGRGDLVLLPWECGFLTWQLTDMPLKPLTVSELQSQVNELSAKFDADPNTFFKGIAVSTETSPRFDRHGRMVSSGPTMYKAPLSPTIANMGRSVSNLLQNIDEGAVKETFASLLGYYMAKSPELRTQKSVLVQGCKDWTMEACGLSVPPYVSEQFMIQLGYSDGRTKRFGSAFSSAPRRSHTGGSSWMGRGQQRNKGRERDPPQWAMQGHALDENDPVGRPEEYRSQRYGMEGRGSHDQRSRDGRGGFDRRDGGESGFGMRR